MPDIHPTAIVDRRAKLAEDVSIGAYSIIKGDVTIGAGTVVQESCHLQGHTIIGSNCKIGPSAFVGLPPQHLKADGRNTSCIIGNDVIIRETASVHRSTHEGLESATRVGDRCFLMGGSHVGHDCVLGNDVVLANAVLLGGHVVLQDRCFIGGGVTLHQFVRVGRIAIISGNEALSRDVPPFAAARYRGLKGYNAIGCRRSGISRETIHAIRAAYHCIHARRTVPDAVADIKDSIPMVPEIKELLDFIEQTHRGVLPSVRAFRSVSSFHSNAERVGVPDDDDDDML